MVEHEVVGFDAREIWLDVNSQWPQTRKDSILLRHDIVKPLSVDRNVWSTVFSELRQPHLWQSLRRKPEYLGNEWNQVFTEDRKLSIPHDSYRPRGVWRNLASMRDYLQQSWGKVWKPCYLVAIVEILEDEAVEKQDREPDPITPSIMDNQWTLLGYDVADYELYTGLFNGTLEPDKVVEIRRKWEKYLNKYHLFVDSEKARDYIQVANERYPSHTPYYVYALYGIQEIGFSLPNPAV